ncbi:uncharacterized protein LOC126844842 [Adelges cooleyi]|uniref:uncharacterized protein LOC126844842 n=1 Tax=Adelges cooleyi TaxID=133065 RepID=UPI0021804003|nr:uncharacterized protein LOC126844842 [Adelges cooleyi]
MDYGCQRHGCDKLKDQSAAGQPLTRSLEKLFENAHMCGELKLCGRRLKSFPAPSKYDVSDTIIADLSKNCFASLPTEVYNFWSLESLSMHNNVIRSIPSTITTLQSLTYLDLSRNYLNSLPPTIFQLPLEILLLSKNKLKQLPSEIGFCKTLLELDVSSNALTNLPSQLGQLLSLKCLNAQNNLLIELPLEITYLKLVKLTVSHNRIASLPVELRLMSSLESFDVANNPLVSPPCDVCTRGRVYIFKWLEMKSVKDGRNRGMSSWKFSSVKNSHHSLDSNMDSLTLSEPASLVHSSDEGANGSIEYINKLDKKNGETNGHNSYNASPEFLRANKSNGGTTSNLINKFINGNNSNGVVGGSNKQNDKPAMHTQSYKEYKEFLKQQRTQDSIYKGKIQNNDQKSSNIIDQKVNINNNLQEVRPYIKPTPPDIIPTSVNNFNLSTVPPSYQRPPMKVWSKDNVAKSKLQFTMKREYEKAKEEAELVKQLRDTIESRLKMSLPSELAPALSDGVVLCYLANHVKPRSVASIHVPSPAVPKLTMARCRRNVDNFLEACRKIGVNEKMICCAVDILEGKGIVQVAITVAELLKFHTPKSPSQSVQVPSMVNPEGTMSLLSCFRRMTSSDQRRQDEFIKEIDLNNSDLTDVPLQLFLYERTLEILLLSSNHIKDLPLPLFHCEQLKVLHLSDNKLDQLPKAIGSLVNLIELDVSRNYLTTIDENIKGCKKLSILNVSVNPLSQFPIPLTQILCLRELCLNDTQLEFVPANIGRLSNLRVLELRDNKISKLPKAVSRLTKLYRLDIGQNDFDSLPSIISELSDLQELWIDFNDIEEISLEISNLHSLWYFDASYNRICTIDEDIQYCSKLKDFHLSFNNLKCLPSSMRHLHELVTMKIDHNSLKQINGIFEGLQNLEELDASYNFLEFLPPSVGLMRKLTVLRLDANRLNDVPIEICSCRNLRELSLRSNNLSSIPDGIGSLQNLIILTLTQNQIKSLPLSILKLTKLNALWLSENQSKPLTPLQNDFDYDTGQHILTCYLLPQIDDVGYSENKQESFKPIRTNTKIRFTLDCDMEEPGNLMRVPTPHPKKMRALAKMFMERKQNNDEIETTTSNNNNPSPIMSNEVDYVTNIDQEAEKMEQLYQMKNNSTIKQTELFSHPIQSVPRVPPPYHIAAAYSKQIPFFYNRKFT